MTLPASAAGRAMRPALDTTARELDHDHMAPRWSLAILPALLSHASTAHAGPSSLPESELTSQSTLIAEGAVVDAACDGLDTVSTFKPAKLLKGEAAGDIKIYMQREKNFKMSCSVPEGQTKPVPKPLAKGWSGKVFLQKDADETYVPTYNESVVEDAATSKPEALPVCDEGAGGAGGSGAGGSAQAGSAQAGSGQAGAGQGGSAGAAPAGGQAGASGGASSGAGGTATTAPGPADGESEDSGCSAGGRGTGGAAALLLAAAAAASRRRRA